MPIQPADRRQLERAVRSPIVQPMIGWGPMSFTTITLHRLVRCGYLTPSFDWRIGRLVLEITEEGREALNREIASDRTSV